MNRIKFDRKKRAQYTGTHAIYTQWRGYYVRVGKIMRKLRFLNDYLRPNHGAIRVV